MNIKVFGSTVLAPHFPASLFEHLENMAALIFGKGHRFVLR